MISHVFLEIAVLSEPSSSNDYYYAIERSIVDPRLVEAPRSPVCVVPHSYILGWAGKVFIHWCTAVHHIPNGLVAMISACHVILTSRGRPGFDSLLRSNSESDSSSKFKVFRRWLTSVVHPFFPFSHLLPYTWETTVLLLLACEW
jgi:hypothetical protein